MQTKQKGASMEKLVASNITSTFKRANYKKVPVIMSLGLIQDDHYYRVKDLEALLKNLGLNFSIFTIRDAETWKCLNYKCGKRHEQEVQKCTRCDGKVRSPLIKSPRGRGGGKGPGHRIYKGSEIREIVEIFKQRR